MPGANVLLKRNSEEDVSTESKKYLAIFGKGRELN